MPAYVIAQVDVFDPVRYEEYKKLAAPTVAAHGGRYLVRGGPVDVLEGKRDPGRVVVLDFPSVARAKEWWASEEYERAKEIRHATATSEIVLIQGV